MLSDIALSHDNQLSEAYIFKGRYFRATGNSEQAMKELDKAIRYNPNNYLGYLYKAVVFGNEDHIKCVNNLQKTTTLNRGSLSVYLKEMGFVFRNAGFPEIATSHWQEALK
jgi:tetratricopeptide (TPR) repeat protein